MSLVSVPFCLDPASFLYFQYTSDILSRSEYFSSWFKRWWGGIQTDSQSIDGGESGQSGVSHDLNASFQVHAYMTCIV